MDGSLAKSLLDARHYRDLNDCLDRQVVPYTVNEAMIASFRDALCRYGTPHSACYWLLMARLTELALLCAGHYADCGEIGAAGDLLVNPRRVDVHLKGAPRPIVKDRHRCITEQFNPEGLPFPAFSNWFSRNAISRVVEPALLPDFQVRLEASGWLSETFLSGLRDRMANVADTMRFTSTDGAAVRTTHKCRFSDTTYRMLGRHIERTCRDPTYQSALLADPWMRDCARAAAAEASFPCSPAQVAV